MTGFTSVEEIWERAPEPIDFDVEQDDMCSFARAFEAWIDQELTPRAAARTRKSINQCKLHLQNKYFQLRERLPQRHRSIGGTGRGHRCVFAVYEEAFHRFDRIERWLEPEPIEDIVQVQVPGPPQRKLLPDNLELGDVGTDPEFGDLSSFGDES